MTEANEHETQLVTTFLEKAKALVPGVKIRYVERVLELGEPGLRIGLALPPGVSLLGDEAFTIDDMAEKFSEAQKYRVTANMTPVAGTGELLTVISISKSDCSEDAVIAVPTQLVSKTAIEATAPTVVARSSQSSSGDKSGRGGATLSVDNSTAIALVVVALLIAVPTVWNSFKAPPVVELPNSTYLSSSPGPSTAAGPRSVEEQQKDIEFKSTELDNKLVQLQMNLLSQGKEAEADRIKKTREKLRAVMGELSNTTDGDQ